MEYKFRDIEKKWQQQWKLNNVYKVTNSTVKPKCYVLDMFPYPSGAGLHVGHPLGYIASDIYSRYKRLKGFNVLHPMGYDAFGLPAEQYAIDHGIHPAISTENNINNFRKQLDNIGFSYDWNREVRTCDPDYYKWTQWIFLKLFNSFYNRNTGKAEPVTTLVAAFEKDGNDEFSMPNAQYSITEFTAEEWKSFDEKTQQDILMQYRLAYCGYGEVNWCEALGTVLANDEVINGVSERGGFPVVKKKLRQWYLRITEYADRLLEGLEKVEFSEAMKEMQTNWIGKSEGAEIDFEVRSQESGVGSRLRVYTTRPDTIFGVDFMVIAPEHELVEQITTAEHKQAVEEYITYVKSRSERERMAEKKISGVFTGAYALNPFDGRKIPVWISEYVLAGYGTGAIMGVPCGDERDHKFAKHFNIPITNIIGDYYNGEEANATKEAILQNSGFLNGMVMKGAIDVVIEALESKSIGVRKVNYKMRDAAFSRQRYWGEPFPIKWINGIAYPLDESELPLELPQVDKYGPGPDGEGPLANIPEWVHQKVKLQRPPQTPPEEGLRSTQGQLLENTNISESARQSGSSKVPSLGGDLGEAGALETNTMPGYAGSSWYFLRYMDPHNDKEFCGRQASDYWNQVDLYIGGTEHAVGHLLYSRMWTKVLHDLDLIGHDEPYKKLVNQGMIQGSSRFVYRIFFANLPQHGIIEFTISQPEEIFISSGWYEKYKENEISKKQLIELVEKVVPGYLNFEGDFEKLPMAISQIHVDVNIVDGLELNISEFRKWRNGEYADSILILEDGTIDTQFPEVWPGVRSDSKYICGTEIEKMSKSKFNTVNPDDLVAKYGADTFRMYEMFLGPVEMSKPWDTKGIEGVHRFLKKFWRLFMDEIKGLIVTNEQPTAAELKVLHNAIRKIDNDTERFSFNTGVSSFMIATNELTDLKCHKRAILEPLLILLAPYAPHITEELYAQLRKVSPPAGGGDLEEAATFILNAPYPVFEAKYVTESTKEYPVSINGKTRTTMNIALDATAEEVEQLVLANEVVQKWIENKPLKKFIFVKGKMINVVV